MSTSRPRLMAISGATLALVVAGTAAVSAHPGRDDERGFGPGPRLRGIEESRGFGGFGGFRAFGGFGDLGIPGHPALGLLGGIDGFIRHETTRDTDAGPLTQRVDNGTVALVGEGSLQYSLATGETASVVTNDDTQVIAFSEETIDFGRGWTRQRWIPQEVELADVEAGAAVVVWSESQDDGSFLAQRVVVPPIAPQSEESPADAGAASDDAASDPIEDAGTLPAAVDA